MLLRHRNCHFRRTAPNPRTCPPGAKRSRRSAIRLRREREERMARPGNKVTLGSSAHTTSRHPRERRAWLSAAYVIVSPTSGRAVMGRVPRRRRVPDLRRRRARAESATFQAITAYDRYLRQSSSLTHPINLIPVEGHRPACECVTRVGIYRVQCRPPSPEEIYVIYCVGESLLVRSVQVADTRNSDA